MPTFDRYILRCTLKPLCATLLVALIVLLLERMLRLLDVVLGSRGSLSVLLEMLAFLVPHYIGLGLPAAFFLGIVLAFNRLNRDSELDAFGATGIGLHVLVRPILGLAVLLTVVAALIFGYLQPHARYTYRALVYQVSQELLNLHLQERVFTRVRNGTFMADRISVNGQHYDKVFLYREDGDGGSTTITAREGALVPPHEGMGAVVALSDGVQLRVDASGNGAGDADRTRSDSLNFERLETAIDRDTVKLFRGRGEDERELTLTELWQRRHQPPEGVASSEMIAEFNNRLVRILSILFLPLFATPLAIQARRHNRAYGMVIGLVILVVFNHLLQVSESLVAAERITPLVGQWALFTAFAAGSCGLFYGASFTVGRGTALRQIWTGRSAVGRLLVSLVPGPKGLPR